MPGPVEPKYIFVDGVMKKNPKYGATQPAGADPKPTVADPNKAITILASTKDVELASEAKMKAGAGPVQLSDATVSSMEIMMDQEHLDKFEVKNIDGGELLDGLSNYFARYEIPIGLVNKLLALSEYKLNFLIDDSGSMNNDTDCTFKEASTHIQKRDPNGSRARSHNPSLTRWEEAEDRIHVMIDMLSFIPTNTITLNFLNRKDKIILEHAGKTPEEFARDAHARVSKIFDTKPRGSTPIYAKLADGFKVAPKMKLADGSDAPVVKTMHYLFTDGVPDESIESVKQLILKRTDPQNSPLTFISCTDNESEANWMKEIEEAAPYTAELDDFLSEREEVLKDQGPGFPFSKGFWLLCQLVAAINPTDLDALDESIPFSKKTMDNLLGRKLTTKEFKEQYFDNNPNAYKYKHLYSQFEREDITAQQILSQSGVQAGSMFNSGASAHQAQNQQPPAYQQSWNYSR